MPLRRILGLSAAVSGRLLRGFSSSASHPAWAMMQPLAELANSTAPRASLRFAEPPCLSRLIIPTHLVHPPSREPCGEEEALMYGGGLKTSSGDGLLLLTFMDISVTAPLVATHGGTRERKLTCVDVRRFVCNPVSGQMFRLPDIDGTMETLCLTEMGIPPNLNARTGRLTGTLSPCSARTATGRRGASSCGGFSRKGGSGRSWWACRPRSHSRGG